MSGPRELVLGGPTYFSPGDEKAFFDWLRSISCVGKVVGRGRNFHITLRTQPSDDQLRELIAVLYRYQMDMKPLAVLRTEHNAGWFVDNPDSYWHARVF